MTARLFGLIHPDGRIYCATAPGAVAGRLAEPEWAGARQILVESTVSVPLRQVVAMVRTTADVWREAGDVAIAAAMSDLAALMEETFGSGE
jgi:hypothetical protein